MIGKVQVLESRSETPTIRSVRFTRPRGFEFKPVQFVGLELDTEEGGIEYSMSLASPPSRDHLEFGARISATPWKKAFAALAPGDEAEIDGPYGHFVLDETRPAVLLAGGIGITPLKGMAEYASDRGVPVDVVLGYSNRTPEEIAFRSRLDALTRSNPRFRILYTITRPRAGDGWSGRTGHFDAAFIEEAARGMTDPNFYLCGTPGMVEGTFDVLHGMGVPRQRILHESFWGYE